MRKPSCECVLTVDKRQLLRSLALWFLCTSILSLAMQAWAMAPSYISDEEFAKYPIIVVARWNKPEFQPHHRQEGNVIKDIEAFTQLEVVRVIRGDVQPGNNKLKIGWGISWSKNGEYVTSGTSTELLGDATNISNLNLWFLQRERSWDKRDKTNYLSISHYRSIQPLALEEYFRCLGSKNPEKETPKLLASDDPEVVRRTLRYVCGGITPELRLEEFDFLASYGEPKNTGKLLNEADAVKRVVEQSKMQEVRAMATMAYWKLNGAGGIPFIRELLRDKNPNVRATAVVLLARQKDEPSVQPINQAVDGFRDGLESCCVVKALAEWGDSRLVPALISFLNNGEYAGAYGDNVFIPALKAKEALYKLTGHYFTLDAQASLRAWENVKHIQSWEERKRQLAQLQPDDPSPLKAEVIGTGTTNAVIRVSNKSKQEITIPRYASWVEQKWPSGSSGCGSQGSKDNESDFVTLKPGDSIQIQATLQESFLLAQPGSRTVTLTYKDNGSRQGLKAWIGLVNADFGAGWTEQRKIETVEEKWPNGNLKSVGETVNGKRIGNWEFFNENGDRTQTIDYTGGGSAVCNPEHPDNKGAGKRAK